MTSEELAWHQAAQKYSDVCSMGGTPEQRTWAAQRMFAALDWYLEHERIQLRRRARAKTVETEAVPASTNMHQFPGRSV